MNMRALSLSSALLIAASSCGLEEQTTDSVGAATGVVEEVPDSGATRPAAPSQTRPALLKIPSDIFNAIPERNATRTAFFGDLHVHTTYSLDAFNVGTLATPYDAYRYALGDTIKHPAGFDMRLRVPLDFYAVTDHAMYLGMLHEAADPSTELNRIMNSDYMEDFNAPENLLPGRFGILGRRSMIESLLSAATRLSRQMATGSSSTRPRRHAGSQGRSQVRPRMPGNTLDSQLTM